MLNSVQHLIKSISYETLKSLDPELDSGQGSRVTKRGFFRDLDKKT